MNHISTIPPENIRLHDYIQNIHKGTDLGSVFEVDGQIKMTILNLWLVDIPYDTENVKLRTLQSRSRDMDEENIIIQELGGKKLSPVGNIFTYDSKNICIIVQPLAITAQ
ncbi:unnamed protein product [Rhizophagus irregularis]|nr:unnamed protein product [Rhizophagus irregularis]CAB5369599.1 unnamed protein product [Rhizophagus irregularis]